MATTVRTKSRRARPPDEPISDAAPVLVAFEPRHYLPEIVATAARLARRRRRAIHVLVTIAVPASLPLDTPMPREEALAESAIEEARVQLGHRVGGHWEKVRSAQAGQNIVNAARTLQASSIVMPTAESPRSSWTQTINTVLRERPCRVVLESIPGWAQSQNGLEVERTASRPPATVVAAPQAAASETPSAADGTDENRDVVLHASKLLLALGALGVVYGDLGTSPLYTEQTIFSYHAASHIGAANVYGITSLIFWTLTLVVSIKYAGVIMKVHNHGDGGIMALATLARRYQIPRWPLYVTLGIVGASLFFGDGVITPAMSVLSAVSGLDVISSSLKHWVVPISVIILLGLFVIQRKGTDRVGALFGPVMLFYFTVIGLMGLLKVVEHPDVFQALLPMWAVRFFLDHGFEAFLTLGGVVLCVTGAEALYADRGHYGAVPIRMSWYCVVFPSVLFCYMGQSASVMAHHANAAHPFFYMFPSWAYIPMTIVATVATIIASQAVISGSYSVARMAMRLGYLPRLKVVHTSKLEGQIYVPVVNLALAIGVIAVVLIFQSSDALANAYGVAVTGTFVLNTVLFLAVYRNRWNPPKWRLWLMGIVFLTVEISFLCANLAKLFHGAWMPLALAVGVTGVMLVWNRGRRIVTANRTAKEGPLSELVAELQHGEFKVTRAPGVGIFLNPGRDTAPLALRAAIEHTNSLHEKVLLVSVVEVSVPVVPDERRFLVEGVGPADLNIRYVEVRVGYQEHIDLPGALATARRELLLERELDLERASYFVSRIAIMPDEHSELPQWQQKLFLGMARNAASAIDHFGLPADRTVSIGAQIPA